MRKTAGAKFNIDERGIYFTALNASDFRTMKKSLTHGLIAINELESAEATTILNEVIDNMPVLIDSGVYNLVNEHARRHNLDMDAALKVPLDELDGYEKLFAKYCEVAERFGPRAWGYIEIDAGGTEQKRRTRARLHDMGLLPIPVYHPLNDPVEYFDELAEKYDRICMGNIVHASRYVRKRLIATLYERKRKVAPNLFVHHLGLTAGEMQMSYAIDSCDSSAWLAGIKYGLAKERCSLKSFSELDKRYRYDQDDRRNPASGYDRGKQLCGYLMSQLGFNLRAIYKSQGGLK